MREFSFQMQRVLFMTPMRDAGYGERGHRILQQLTLDKRERSSRARSNIPGKLWIIGLRFSAFTLKLHHSAFMKGWRGAIRDDDNARVAAGGRQDTGHEREQGGVHPGGHRLAIRGEGQRPGTDDDDLIRFGSRGVLSECKVFLKYKIRIPPNIKANLKWRQI